MPDRSGPRRSVAIGALSVGSLLLSGLVASAQQPPGSPAPAASPPSVASSPAPTALANTPVPGSSPSVTAYPSTSAIAFYPLPDSVAVIPPDIPTVSVEPESAEELGVGETIDFTLGHCGLWSPIDLDGSIWQAIGGVTPAGGAILEGDDAVIGELINATPGTFTLTGEDTARFTTITGTILDLVRAPRAVGFPLCV